MLKCNEKTKQETRTFGILYSLPSLRYTKRQHSQTGLLLDVSADVGGRHFGVDAGLSLLVAAFAPGHDAHKLAVGDEGAARVTLQVKMTFFFDHQLIKRAQERV